MVFNNDFSSGKTLFNILGCNEDDNLFPEGAHASTACGNVLQAKVEAPNTECIRAQLSWAFLCSWQSCLVAEVLPLSSEETQRKKFEIGFFSSEISLSAFNRMLNSCYVFPGISH